MTKNQFLTDTRLYLETITPNFKQSTIDEKSRKLAYFSDIMYHLYEEGKISTLSPSKLTPEDLNAYVTFRRSQGICDTTIAKDLSIIGGLLTWRGNNARDIYSVQFGNKKPLSYNGRLEPLSNIAIDRIYELARATTDWPTMQGCMAATLGSSAGLRPQESRMLYADGIRLNGNRSTVFIEHVKGEGVWGKPRNAPIVDDVCDIYTKYLRMREEKLREFGIESRAMFPPLRGSEEFVTQQSLNRFKSCVENIIGYRFELRDARRAYGQRMIDRGVRIEHVSGAMGHSSIKTTQKYYAGYRENDILDNVFAVVNGGGLRNGFA